MKKNIKFFSKFYLFLFSFSFFLTSCNVGSTPNDSGKMENPTEINEKNNGSVGLKDNVISSTKDNLQENKDNEILDKNPKSTPSDSSNLAPNNANNKVNLMPEDNEAKQKEEETPKNDVDNKIKPVNEDNEAKQKEEEIPKNNPDNKIKPIVEDNESNSNKEQMTNDLANDSNKLLQNLKQGGNYNNLIFDSYLLIGKTLELSKETKLNTLTNQLLTKKIQTDKNFENLSLRIESGDQSKGILTLIIFGKYTENNFIHDNRIKITNFNSTSEDYQIINSGEISEITIGENYFTNLQDNENIKNWNTEDWLEIYPEKFTARSISSHNRKFIDLKRLYSESIIEDVQINNINNFIDKKGNNGNLKFSYFNYQYQNEQWIRIEEGQKNKFTYDFANEFLIKTLNVYDAAQYAIKNKITINNNNIETYASDYIWRFQDGAGNIDNDQIGPRIGENLIHIDEEFQAKYFDMSSEDASNHLQIRIDLDQTNAEDFNGILNLSIIFYMPNLQTSNKLFKAYQMTNFLKLKDFLLANNAPEKNLIFIKDTSTTYQRILRFMKTKKSELNNLENNAKLNFLNEKPIPLNSNLYSYYFYNSERENKQGLFNDVLLNTANFQLLNKKFDNSNHNFALKTHTNLFHTNGRTSPKFYIRSINITINGLDDVSIEKLNNNYIYTAPVKYIISLSEEDFEIDTYYKASIPEAKINS